jgi:predicted nucleotidyltransferase
MSNIGVAKWTALQSALFRALCRTAGTKINQRALAAKVGVTPAAISRALPALGRDGLVVIKNYGAMNLKEIEINRENHHAIRLKVVENLRALYLSGFVDCVAETYAGCGIVLFGSFARGEDIVSSDIDIAVIGAREKRVDFTHFEKRLDRPLRIMCISSLGKLSKEFKESIINGIPLEGTISL